MLAKCNRPLTLKGGFLFVNVTDDFIEESTNYFQTYDKEFQKTPSSVGAHITVIGRKEINDVSPEGQEWIEEQKQKEAKNRTLIYFTPEKFAFVKSVSYFQRHVELLVFHVRANELDQIRKKCGLAPRIYPFHITLAMKYI